MSEKKQRIEFGDFQTPNSLAIEVCERLKELGICPDVVIEPTCGVGAFVLASVEHFPEAKKIFGYEVNPAYLENLRQKISALPSSEQEKISLEHADFFATNWPERLEKCSGSLLVVGNFPWVTNATQGAIGGINLPEKSNFLGFNGFDAISGKANFDISEWMLLEVLKWFSGRSGDIAMLVKTAVARKVLAHVERQRFPIKEASIIGINAKRDFGAAVDACLLVIRVGTTEQKDFNYAVYTDLKDVHGKRVGHRLGMTVGDLDAFDASSFLMGKSPQKWRSGVKHDASSIMEFTKVLDGYENGYGKIYDLEGRYLFPLLKGSDIGSNKDWRKKYVLVTQQSVGEQTSAIQEMAPKTWDYLSEYSESLDARGSTIYKKNPRFSIFGIGDYAFRPWKIAICGLYKKLKFRLVGPIEEKPVMFDDTVYYISFDTKDEAVAVFEKLHSHEAINFLSSLIFWDEKRPIKTSVLNLLDWSKLGDVQPQQAELVY